VLIKNGDVFRFALADGQYMFGVISNANKQRATCNIYNYTGSQECVSGAIESDILLYDMLITGSYFEEGGWELISGMVDHSDKSKIKEPYRVFGIPPSKLIKLDDSEYNQKITSPEKAQKLIEKHGFLAFNFPQGNVTVAEEAYFYGRRTLYGTDLASCDKAELQLFYNEEQEYMSEFQKNNFLKRWGDKIIP